MPRAVIHPSSRAKQNRSDLCISGYHAAAAHHLPSLECFLIDCIPSCASFLIKEMERGRKELKEGGQKGGEEGERREREQGASMQTTVISQHPQTDWWTCRAEKAHPQSKCKLTCLLHFCVCSNHVSAEHWIVLPNRLLLPHLYWLGQLEEERRIIHVLPSVQKTRNDTATIKPLQIEGNFSCVPKSQDIKAEIKSQQPGGSRYVVPLQLQQVALIR